MKESKNKSNVFGTETPNEHCPICNSDFKIRIVGKKLRKDDEPENRDEYQCGAVILTNRNYPAGMIEARCCVDK